MTEIIDMILTFLFWYAIGWFIFNFVVRPWAQSRLEERIRELDQEIADIKKVYKRVKIEQYSDTFYLFDAETDQFIGQGRTAQEVSERIRTEITLNVIEGDPDVIERFRRTVPQTDSA
jgi:hypothetical protein